MDHSRRAQYITKWTAFSVTQYTINFFGCLLRWVQVVKRKDHGCFDRITPIFKSEKALEKKQTKLKDIPMDGCRRSSKNLIKLVLPPACIVAQCDTHLCYLKTHQTRFLQPSQAARLGRAIVKKKKEKSSVGLEIIKTRAHQCSEAGRVRQSSLDGRLRRQESSCQNSLNHETAFKARSCENQPNPTWWPILSSSGVPII